MGVEPIISDLWGQRLNRFTHPQYLYSSLLGGHISQIINITVITIGTNSTSNVLLLSPAGYFPYYTEILTLFPYFPYCVEMGGVEPPSWQQCHKVIHKFSWFLFLPTKSTFLNSFSLASRLSVVIPTIVLPISSPLYPLSEVREWWKPT